MTKTELPILWVFYWLLVLQSCKSFIISIVEAYPEFSSDQKQERWSRQNEERSPEFKTDSAESTSNEGTVWNISLQFIFLCDSVIQLPSILEKFNVKPLGAQIVFSTNDKRLFLWKYGVSFRALVSIRFSYFDSEYYHAIRLFC